jgi:hypothetical protein
MSERKYPTSNEHKEKIYQEYIKEKEEARRLNITPFPLHLYSKRVYRAYKNVWKFIDRKYLTPEEINILLKLGIYKPTQNELCSNQSLSIEERKEISKTRIGLF